MISLQLKTGAVEVERSQDEQAYIGELRKQLKLRGIDTRSSSAMQSYMNTTTARGNVYKVYIDPELSQDDHFPSYCEGPKNGCQDMLHDWFPSFKSGFSN